MKYWKKDEIIARIKEILPEGKVIPRHNSKGHFYEVVEGRNPIYPSVTGKIQVLKDEGLINYKMNRAIEYLKNFIFSMHTSASGPVMPPSMEQIDHACEMASRVSQDILQDAGDIGTRIHNFREKIFQQWIDTGVRPRDFPSFIPAEEEDIRVVSAMRALEKFCIEKDYIPVACELLVYSHQLGVAGTLDDLGLMRKILRNPPDADGCGHPVGFIEGTNGKFTCERCGYQYRYEFVLVDLKTSNQFKDHYFFQVALYWWMLWQLLGRIWKPERAFILKVSKEDGSYKLEELFFLPKLAEFCRAMIKTNEGIDFIKSIRKDNQKVVAPLMQL